MDVIDSKQDGTHDFKIDEQLVQGERLFEDFPVEDDFFLTNLGTGGSIPINQEYLDVIDEDENSIGISLAESNDSSSAFAEFFDPAFIEKTQSKALTDALLYPKGFVKRLAIERENLLSATKNRTLTLDERLEKFPGGLDLKQSESIKYFGEVAKGEFFDRYKWIMNQKDILSTSSTSETKSLLLDGFSLTVPRSSVNSIESKKESNTENYSFAPVRSVVPVKSSVKVLIRSSTLDGSTVSQMKFVSIPTDVVKLHKLLLSDVKDDEDVVNSNNKINNLDDILSSLRPIQTKNLDIPHPSTPPTLSLASVATRLHQQNTQKRKSSVIVPNDLSIPSGTVVTNTLPPVPVHSTTQIQKRAPGMDISTYLSQTLGSNPTEISNNQSNLIATNQKLISETPSSKKSTKAARYTSKILLSPLMKPKNTSFLDNSNNNSNNNNEKSSKKATVASVETSSNNFPVVAIKSNKIKKNSRAKERKLSLPSPSKEANISNNSNNNKIVLSHAASTSSIPIDNTTSISAQSSSSSMRSMNNKEPLTGNDSTTNSNDVINNEDGKSIISVGNNRSSFREVANTIVQTAKRRSSLTIESLPTTDVSQNETEFHGKSAYLANGDFYNDFIKFSNERKVKITNISKDVPEPLQLVCIEHRDDKNRKLKITSQSNTLLKYVESKKITYDFNSDESASDSESDEKLLYENALHAYELSKPENFNSNSPSKIYNNHDNNNNNSNTNESKETKDSEQQGLSPRSRYIDSCIRKRLNPRASLILRKKFTKKLNVSHYGMGDEMAILFAEAIVDIPFIESLNIEDNNLTDKGLKPLVLTIRKMKDLIDLNVSYCTIGPEAAAALAEYLSDPTCPLERFVLRRADVDDGECERFITALKTNRYLKELDLGENLIGSAENLNAVMPDIVTGGEAIADLLTSDGCALTSLKLDWNMLRLDGAVTLCSSLSANSTLTHLDLSFNSLGTQGGMALGDALQDNRTLRSLIVANNTIDSVACISICAGILENLHLQKVVFDGNPIGEGGAKAVMLLPTMVGGRVRVSLASCNIGIRDPQCWFDPTSILRRFECNLSNIFDRSVAFFLLNLVPSHNTYTISSSEWFDPTEKGNKPINLDLKQIIATNTDLDRDQLELLRKMRLLQEAASDKKKAMELFYQIDEDGSGKLDETEFSNLLDEIGIDLNGQSVRTVMSEYDVDSCGIIELDEFSLFLRKQSKLANSRIKELTELHVMSSEADCEAKGLAKSRYIPPRKGILRLSILDTFTQKESHRVINGSDRKYINEIAKQSGDVLAMTSFGVNNYKIRLDEAQRMTETLLLETSSKITVLAKVLPQMQHPEESRMLISQVLQQNDLEVQRLKRELGNSYRPITGSCDGYYQLDLSNAMDKLCLNRLIEISLTRSHFRSKARSFLGYRMIGDCSQKGNWTGFRNELFNGKPVVVNAEFASPMPKSGKLEFDFVSERRWNQDSLALTDSKVLNLLAKSFLIRSNEKMGLAELLHKSRRMTNKTLKGDATTVYECPMARARDIGIAQARFYDNLTLRHDQFEKNKHFESIKTSLIEIPELHHHNVSLYYQIPSQLVNDQPEEVRGTIPGTGKRGKKTAAPSAAALRNFFIRSSSFGVNASPEALTEIKFHQTDVNYFFNHNIPLPLNDQNSPKKIEDDINLALESNETFDQAEDSNQTLLLSQSKSNNNLDIINDNNSNNNQSTLTINTDMSDIASQLVASKNEIDALYDSANNSPLKDSHTISSVDESLIRYIRVMGTKTGLTISSKATRMLELIVNLFENTFIKARHLELLCIIFRHYGNTLNSEFFGTYRVELVVSLFSSVVDLHNFEIVMRTLSSYEAACVYCRIGWLHIYNPMKSEGSFELDLGRREERIVVKTLTTLSVVEPGDNIPEVQFRWEREMDPMPGYELTELWLTEDGLPKKGLWDVRYYAGEGKGLKDCKPAIKMRKAMLNL
eukprot:gene5859-8083_t